MNKIITSLLLLLLLIQASFAQQVDSIKILAIGNSFSEDAIESYLYDLAKAATKKIIIANLYIGGAPLELHVTNASADKAIYSYRKITPDGVKTISKNKSISQAIQEENWDYISLQQASSFSGQYTVIMKSLPTLIDYVNGLKPSSTKLLYHQTWAYQEDSKHKGFANYNNNQTSMYEAIVDATKKINKSRAFAYVVPSGTAIQNARSSSIGDKYTRDGYHLQPDYGRFTAACTWYALLFNEDVRKNTYKPEKVSELQAKIAKEAAQKAIRKPFKVSKINL